MAEDKKAKSEAKPKRDKAPKAGKKGGGAERSDTQAVAVSTTDAVPPRKFEAYKQTAVPALIKQFNYKNPMQVPRLEKIVVNMGLGAAVANPKIIDTAIEELKALSGQRPVVTRATKAIANFKLRAASPIGDIVTLRSTLIWEFLDRLVTVALPR